ncbi:peptidylprolyl isomerase [Chloroflexota bacterium]
MSQSRNRRAGRRTAGQTQSPEVKIVYRNQISKRTTIVISTVVIALIAIIIFISNYFSADGKYMRLDVITVDDISVSMEYFVKRAHISGSDPMALLGIIAKEKVMSLIAPELGIEISEEAVDQELRVIARGDSETFSENEFKEWYRQTLNESRLSDSEYRELVKISLISGIIWDYLADQLPTTAEHIHVHSIMTTTENEALKVKERLEAGEDFAALAMESSIDATSRDNGGDLGWTPHGVLNPQIEYDIWDMEIGVISDPIVLYDLDDPSNMEPLGYYIIMISERTDSREVDESFLPTIQNNAFDAWFAEQTKNYDINYHGLYNGFDSEAYAWINYQLSKREE